MCVNKIKAMKIYLITAEKIFKSKLGSIVDKNSRFFSFFIYNEGREFYFQNTMPTVNFNEITLRQLSSSDYLPINIGVPIFSERAADLIHKECPSVANYACVVNCKDGCTIFYAAKINDSAFIINKEKSEFRNLTDGTEVLSKPSFFHDVEDDFFLARDIENRHIWCASEKFVKLCKSANLKIDFVEMNS